jgi:predicted metal-dependent hydrolase
MTDEQRISAHDGPRMRPRIGKIGRGEATNRCAAAPPPALLQGIAEFNRGEFFEQHETLEAAWIEEEDPIRYLYQGILQIGVGFHHLSRGNRYGARRLWTRGMVLLDSFRPVCMTVDVERLCEETRQCLAELDRVEAIPAEEFDAGLVPQVHLVAATG